MIMEDLNARYSDISLITYVKVSSDIIRMFSSSCTDPLLKVIPHLGAETNEIAILEFVTQRGNWYPSGD